MQLIAPNYINEKERELALLFCAKNERKKYILGINKLTKSLLKVLEVDGVIDDFTRVARSRKKEVLSIDAVPKDALILYTSTGSPLTVKRRLTEMGFESLSYLALLKYTSLPLAAHPFMMDFGADYALNAISYQDTYNLLADQKSKEIFIKLLNFKISFDYSFMEGFTNKNAQQYFDDEIIPKMKNIVFVDGGGYVGDTASELIKNYPDFKKIYLFEPIESNLRIAKRELAEYENIEFIASGLWNTKEILYFDEEKSFSTSSKNGSQIINADTIDNLIDEKIDYIKLDIEGAELQAIEGAKESIKKYKPILAICIYHKAEDWYKVPQKVLSIESGYKLYLRHYMEGIFESVLYFIPRLNHP